ncbi:hypothetical protein VULLAG_LOCUS17623 [Vulpes lagopus]
MGAGSQTAAGEEAEEAAHLEQSLERFAFEGKRRRKCGQELSRERSRTRGTETCAGGWEGLPEGPWRTAGSTLLTGASWGAQGEQGAESSMHGGVSPHPRPLPPTLPRGGAPLPPPRQHNVQPSASTEAA